MTRSARRIAQSRRLKTKGLIAVFSSRMLYCTTIASSAAMPMS
jgi:hypothetical protein